VLPGWSAVKRADGPTDRSTVGSHLRSIKARGETPKSSRGGKSRRREEERKREKERARGGGR